MSDQFIPVNTPLLGGNELEYVTDCIKTGWISSEGSYVARFEEAVAEKVNRNFGIAVSNGTAAIDIAVAALNIGEGDEVIMPTHTIISCITQIIRAGAKPIFVDSDPLTWNMDVNQIEAKITDRTKAIMAVHLYGLPAEMDTILGLAKKYHLKVIEDASQMLGQTYNGKPCGSFGDISTMSFYPNKQITTGEGGMCLTNDKELEERCKSLRNLCFKPEKRFLHEELGWNYRMTNIQAAIGLAQVERLDYHIQRKREVGNKYLELLKDIPNISLPVKSTDYADNVYWIFGILLEKGHRFNATEVMKRLSEKGVGVRPFFYPLHKQPVFTNKGYFKGESYPNADFMAENGFYIPSGLGITNEEMERVADIVNQVLR
ncbi:DegT/DnrJ/EryC1/StrS family aminotransferase [Marinifilum flexuosum]|uniref:DegT/DnrJ/EryC1/StrS family aminotransferase n=1 Tax=Marinifilum flexuosum TaxID=1117708 RepID=UPI00249474CE|nr:DegT/DnrJ/EryC1/StrS family aminotransferase [Marinifilum flexuosum]